MSQDMFDLPWPEAVARAHRREGEAATKEKAVVDPDTVTWRRITTVARPKCDVCIQRMEHGARWAAPDPVAWERRGHGTLAFYCYFHAAPLRILEGVEVVK
jgi:hypothetical protein